MEILNFIVFGVLGQASLLVGMISLVGLILQKKSATKVLSGTLKTIVGFVIFGIGSAAASDALTAFQELFTRGFNVKGVLPLKQ